MHGLNFNLTETILSLDIFGTVVDAIPKMRDPRMKIEFTSLFLQTGIIYMGVCLLKRGGGNKKKLGISKLSLLRTVRQVLLRLLVTTETWTSEFKSFQSLVVQGCQP